MLRQQFEQSACGKAWLAWAKASVLDESSIPFQPSLSLKHAAIPGRDGQAARPDAAKVVH